MTKKGTVMPAPLMPADFIFWSLPLRQVRQLKQDAQADVVIIGGGMAGIHAARSFKEKGCSVILIEKNFCGAGASGKSSGFITPDSEFSLSSCIERYGREKAQQLWQFVSSGVDAIRKTIEMHDISCDYQVQDTLILATSQRGFSSEIEVEYKARTSLGYASTLYDRDQVASVIGSTDYQGAVSYKDTFGINSYLYLQAMKELLLSQGVEIYEETPALSVDQNVVTTPYGKISARYIVLCADRFTPDLGRLTYEISQVQTFLMISAPLTAREIDQIFPQGPCLTWDTDLIYQYFRITGDNRLLLGGSSVFDTYTSKPHHNNVRIYKKLMRYFRAKFPEVNPHFEYMWPGLIGVSKDIMPLAGADKEQPSLYYVAAATGLPWAAALGGYAADALIDGRSDLNDIFSPYREFRFGHTIQKILGTRLTFALSHLTSLQSF